MKNILKKGILINIPNIYCKYANFKLHANHLVVHIILIYSEAAFYHQSIVSKEEIIENKQ